MIKKIALFLLLISPLCFMAPKQSHESKSFENTLNLMENSAESDAFIDYWKNTFRTKPTCDITYEEFLVMIQKYRALSSQDKAIVDATDDVEPGYKIKDVIQTLINRFYKLDPKDAEKKDTLDKSTTIIIVVSVAVFGMSTISVFFMLKNRKVIN